MQLASGKSMRLHGRKATPVAPTTLLPADRATRARAPGGRVAPIAVAGQAPATTSQALLSASDLSSEYNRRMKDAMGWESRPYQYDYTRGLYYHEILPHLFVGSQPRHAADVEELHRDLGITHILSLQQDKDMHWWGVKPEEIRHKCENLGIHLVRRPVKDFDPHSLRKVLPSAVSALHAARAAGGRVYVHCTAGLGRAPGVVIAYLHWYHSLDLHQAYDTLTSIRPCGPKKEAIRGATFDLMSGQPMDHFERLPSHAWTDLNEHDRVRLQREVSRR